jgi:methionyl-tRNA formyltransferase
MKVAIIGRTEILYDTALLLRQAGHEVSCILTAKEALEYTRTADDYRRLAAQWNVPFAEGPHILEHADFLRATDSDIAVSINYTGVVPQEVIDIFPLGILNAHGGDLPRYRGNACQAWAILNGESRIGLCIHRMIGDELDSGDIIARDYLPIDLNTKVTQAWNWMVERSPALMLEAVEQLARDPDYVLERQSKNPADALRCYPRRPEDGLIDWNRSASDILRLVNACARPYAGAFCVFQGQHMIVWDACISPTTEERFLAVPGQVTEICEGYLDVACGRGKLRLLSIEWGGEEISPGQLVRSLRTRLS